MKEVYMVPVHLHTFQVLFLPTVYVPSAAAVASFRLPAEIPFLAHPD